MPFSNHLIFLFFRDELVLFHYSSKYLEHTEASANTADCLNALYRVLVASFDKTDADSLKAAAEHLLSKLGDPAAVVVGSSPGDGKVSLVATFSPSVVKKGVQAGKLVGTIARMCGGNGGGRPNFAQAGGRQPEKLEEALEKAREDIKSQLSK
jgi:alanyl-tRNA synthetase